MEFIFEPARGAIPLLFGMRRAVVRTDVLKGSPFFTNASEPENDFYEHEGMILGYDKLDVLEFVEVIAPSRCTYRGIDLVNSETAQVMSEMRRLG